MSSSSPSTHSIVTTSASTSATSATSSHNHLVSGSDVDDDDEDEMIGAHVTSDQEDDEDDGNDLAADAGSTGRVSRLSSYESVTDPDLMFSCDVVRDVVVVTPSISSIMSDDMDDAAAVVTVPSLHSNCNRLVTGSLQKSLTGMKSGVGKCDTASSVNIISSGIIRNHNRNSMSHRHRQRHQSVVDDLDEEADLVAEAAKRNGRAICISGLTRNRLNHRGLDDDEDDNNVQDQDDDDDVEDNPVGMEDDDGMDACLALHELKNESVNPPDFVSCILKDPFATSSSPSPTLLTHEHPVTLSNRVKKSNKCNGQNHQQGSSSRSRNQKKQVSRQVKQNSSKNNSEQLFVPQQPNVIQTVSGAKSAAHVPKACTSSSPRKLDADSSTSSGNPKPMSALQQRSPLLGSLISNGVSSTTGNNGLTSHQLHHPTPAATAVVLTQGPCHIANGGHIVLHNSSDISSSSGHSGGSHINGHSVNAAPADTTTVSKSEQRHVLSPAAPAVTNQLNSSHANVTLTAPAVHSGQQQQHAAAAQQSLIIQLASNLAAVIPANAAAAALGQSSNQPKQQQIAIQLLREDGTSIILPITTSSATPNNGRVTNGNATVLLQTTNPLDPQSRPTIITTSAGTPVLQQQQITAHSGGAILAHVLTNQQNSDSNTQQLVLQQHSDGSTSNPMTSMTSSSATATTTATSATICTDADRPFKCELCNSTFTRLGNYTRHKKIHSLPTKEDQRFRCDICSKSFIQRCDLARHLHIHRGTEPHRCPQCGKGYIRHSDLVTHQRFHNKEKPFTCPHCSKGFCQRGDLNRHLRSIHLQLKPILCTHCHKKFAKEETLLRHINSTHRDKLTME